MTNEQLVIRIKAGENEDRNMLQLYEQVKAFIHTVALRYRGHAELDDLEQEGYLALYPAIDGYDPDKGVKFLTYAEYHIRQQMQRYIQMNGSCLRMPIHCLERVRRYKKLHSSYLMEQGREPSDEAMACCMGLPLEQIRCIKKDACMASVGSLDASLPEDEELTLGDTVAGDDDPEGDILECMQHEQLQGVIWPMVDALPEKQGQVIRMRYQGRMTLKETGQQIGVNIEVARQWERKAMKGLRRSGNLRRLQPFLPEVMESMAYRGGGVERFNRTWTSSTERAALEL